jgi:hypothetical protein
MRKRYPKKPEAILTVNQVISQHGKTIIELGLGRAALQRWLNDNLPGSYSMNFARTVLKGLNARGKCEKMHSSETEKMHSPQSEKMHSPQSEKTQRRGGGIEKAHSADRGSSSARAAEIDPTEDALRKLFNMSEGWRAVRVWGSAERPLVKWERDGNGVTEEEIYEVIDGIPSVTLNSTRSTGGETEEMIAVLSIRDAHFGMDTSHPYPYAKYDLDEASSAFVDAGTFLIDKAVKEGVKQLVIPFGSDTLHVDNAANTTTKGTPQETNGLWWEAFEVAMHSLITVVEYARDSMHEVTLVLEQGNHDYNLSRALAASLERRWDDVVILGSHNSVKRIEFGNTHLFFHHGKDIKADAYLMVIANTYPDSMRPENYLEILTGHYHHRNKTVLNGGGDYWESGRLNYRITPALCPSSNWAEAAGFNSQPGAQLTIYDMLGFRSMHEWTPRRG